MFSLCLISSQSTSFYMFDPFPCICCHVAWMFYCECVECFAWENSFGTHYWCLFPRLWKCPNIICSTVWLFILSELCFSWSRYSLLTYLDEVNKFKIWFHVSPKYNISVLKSHMTRAPEKILRTNAKMFTNIEKSVSPSQTWIKKLTRRRSRHFNNAHE